METLKLRIARSLKALLMLMALPALFNAVHAAENSELSSLEKTEDWELVQANCTECHSSQIIAQNSGTREVWLSRIRWMQDTQGLKELDAALENSILGYLSSNYGPKASSRRQALADHFLPTNPYALNE